MGRTKQYYLEEEERGFSASRDLFICQNHFQDKDITDYFLAHGEFNRECTFCDDDRKEFMKISWFDLLNRIVPCLKHFYDDPANGLSYVSKEGGYQGNTYSTMELLQDIVMLEADFEVIQEIARSITQDIWTEAKFYGESYSDHLIYNWETFGNLVRYKVRYLFNDVDNKDIYNDRFMPLLILKEIGNCIKEVDLITEFSENNDLFNEEVKIYRARQHKSNYKIEKCLDIGSAPNTLAGANRFSAEGISIFYGAEDEETAIKEIINLPAKDEVISIGEFMPAKKLNLIDLRKIKPIGIFNKEKLRLVEPLRFLVAFVRNISKKITDDVKDTIEYVPSQIVTEYFRFTLPKFLGKEIHGIVYESIQNPGRKCYAIFADSSKCSDDDNVNDQTVLILKRGTIKQRNLIC